ncbi:MAG: hypothetical protein IRZ16_09655 [Myxococcaceae bacterium]|nr:hypothetical protein [Myxococcaceae bacterium]
MRSRWPLHLLFLWMTGCGVPRAEYLAKAARVHELERERAALKEQLERLEAERLDLLVTIDELTARRELVEARAKNLEDALAAQKEQAAELAAINAALSARQQELLKLSEQISDVWFNSALERARRAAHADGAEAGTPSQPADVPVAQ